MSLAMVDLPLPEPPSRPLAFSASIIWTPFTEVPLILPCSLSRRRFTSSRAREASRSTTRLTRTTAIATSVNGTL